MLPPTGSRQRPLRRYKGIIDYRLKPVLGAKRLDRLTALDITKARDRWLAGKNGVKPGGAATAANDAHGLRPWNTSLTPAAPSDRPADRPR